MSKFGNELIESLTEAVDHAEGKANSARVLQVVNVIDVRADPELTTPTVFPQ